MAQVVGWAKKARSQLEVLLAACATRFVSLASNGFANPAQLASGTRTGAKFLRDDGTWQAAPGGTTPTGTGFTHITAGAQDAAAAFMTYEPHSISSAFTLTAGYGTVVPRYIEVAAGITLEVGAGSDLEVT